MRHLAVVTGLLIALASPLRAETAADVAIVLAVDASSSVNYTEFGLQMTGIARALRSAEVLRTVRSGPSGAVAITMVQWSGPEQARQAFPWRLVTDVASAEALADEIENTPRFFHAGSTAVGRALMVSASMFAKLPWPAGRRVIDVSGDGQNTDNPPVAPVRAAVLGQGITINGLPILAQEKDIDRYYRERVIGGENAFVEVADDYEAFEAAMTRKLIREIRSDPLLSALEPSKVRQ
ncbi:DUF1194 domain-containing protein [Minwuia sp.]|uniref:DUF1194 domain-containing protein n=1 Tax=Minwuia sp. TaxID=2493630 RepID=UPI003A95CABB